MKRFFKIILTVTLISCTTNINDKVEVRDYRTCTSDDLADCPKSYYKYNRLADSLKQVINSAIDFRIWYVENYDSLNTGVFFEYSEKLGYNTFNMQKANRYLQLMQNSGFVSNYFIEMMRTDFIKYDKYLQKEKFPFGTEDIGYPADVVTGYQERVSYSLDRDNEDHQVEHISLFSDSSIRVYFKYDGTNMIKESGKWVFFE